MEKKNDLQKEQRIREKTERAKRGIRDTIVFLLVASVIVIMALLNFGTVGIAIVTILMCCIGGFALYLSPKAYNESVEGVKIMKIPSNMTIEDLYECLKGTAIGTGEATLATVTGVGKKKSIVYLLSDKEEFYYIYKSKVKNTIIIAYSTMVSMLKDMPKHSSSGIVEQYGNYQNGVWAAEQTFAVIQQMINQRLSEKYPDWNPEKKDSVSGPLGWIVRFVDWFQSRRIVGLLYMAAGLLAEVGFSIYMNADITEDSSGGVVFLFMFVIFPLGVILMIIGIWKLIWHNLIHRHK